MPVVVQRQVGWSRQCSKLLSFGSWCWLLDKVVDVPVLATSRVCRGSAAVHRLVVASLHGDEVDATTVSFLLRENLRRTKLEEEEKERRRVQAEAAEAMDQEWLFLEQAGKRRKRKRRRKKKLPRTSSHSSCGRARRRRRQWRDRCAGFVGCDMFLLCRRLARDARHRGRYGPAGCCFRRGYGSGICMADFAHFAPCAVFSVLVVRPKMLDIMAGVDQKDSYVVLSCHGAEAVSHGSGSADPCDSAVTVRCQVVDVLFVLVLQVPQVQFLEKVVDVPVVCDVRCWP